MRLCESLEVGHWRQLHDSDSDHASRREPGLATEQDSDRDSAESDESEVPSFLKRGTSPVASLTADCTCTLCTTGTLSATGTLRTT